LGFQRRDGPPRQQEVAAGAPSHWVPSGSWPPQPLNGCVGEAFHPWASTLQWPRPTRNWFQATSRLSFANPLIAARFAILAFGISRTVFAPRFCSSSASSRRNSARFAYAREVAASVLL